MRKIIVLSFITLDGVVQLPGAPDEDIAGNFDLGGWVTPYSDAVGDQFMEYVFSSGLSLRFSELAAHLSLLTNLTVQNGLTRTALLISSIRNPGIRVLLPLEYT